MGGLVLAPLDVVVKRVNPHAVPPPPQLLGGPRPQVLVRADPPADLPEHISPLLPPFAVNEHNSITCFGRLTLHGISQYMPKGTAELMAEARELIIGEKGIIRLGIKCNPKGKHAFSCGSVLVKIAHGYLCPVAQGCGEGELAQAIQKLVHIMILICAPAMEAFVSREEIDHLKAQAIASNPVTMGDPSNINATGLQINCQIAGARIDIELGDFGKPHDDFGDDGQGGTIVAELSNIKLVTAKVHGGGTALVEPAAIVESEGCGLTQFDGGQIHNPIGAGLAPDVTELWGFDGNEAFRCTGVMYTGRKAFTGKDERGKDVKLAYNDPEYAVSEGKTRHYSGFRSEGENFFGVHNLPAPSRELWERSDALNTASLLETGQPYPFLINPATVEDVPTGPSPLGRLYDDPNGAPGLKEDERPADPCRPESLQPEWTAHHIHRARHLKLANGDPQVFAHITGRAKYFSFCCRHEARMAYDKQQAKPSIFPPKSMRDLHDRFAAGGFIDPRYLHPVPAPWMPWFPGDADSVVPLALLKIHRDMRATFQVHRIAASRERKQPRLGTAEDEAAQAVSTLDVSPHIQLDSQRILNPVLVALNEQLDCASAGEDTTGEDTTSNHSADQEDQVGTPESSVEAETTQSQDGKDEDQLMDDDELDEPQFTNEPENDPSSKVSEPAPDAAVPMELDANADVLGAVEVEGHVLEDNEDISDAAVGAMPSTSSAPMETEETAVNPAEETAMVVRADRHVATLQFEDDDGVCFSPPTVQTRRRLLEQAPEMLAVAHTATARLSQDITAALQGANKGHLQQASNIIGLMRSAMALRREQQTNGVAIEGMGIDPQWAIINRAHTQLIHQSQQAGLRHLNLLMAQMLEYYSRPGEAAAWHHVHKFCTTSLRELVIYSLDYVDKGSTRVNFRGPAGMYDLAVFFVSQVAIVHSNPDYEPVGVPGAIVSQINSAGALGESLPATLVVDPEIWSPKREGRPRLCGGTGGIPLLVQLRRAGRREESSIGLLLSLFTRLAEDVIILPLVEGMLRRAIFMDQQRRKEEVDIHISGNRTDYLSRLVVRNEVVMRITSTAKDMGVTRPSEVFAIDHIIQCVRDPSLLPDVTADKRKVKLYSVARGSNPVLDSALFTAEKAMRILDAAIINSSLQHLRDSMSAVMQNFEAGVKKPKQIRKLAIDSWVTDEGTHPFELFAIFYNEQVRAAFNGQSRNPRLYKWIKEDPDKRCMPREFGPTVRNMLEHCHRCVDLKQIFTVFVTRLSSFGMTSKDLYSAKGSNALYFNTMDPVIFGPEDFPDKIYRAIQEKVRISDPGCYGTWSDTAQHPANARAVAYNTDWIISKLKLWKLYPILGTAKTLPYDELPTYAVVREAVDTSGIRGAGGVLTASLITSDLALLGVCQHATAEDMNGAAYGGLRGTALQDISIKNPSLLSKVQVAEHMDRTCRFVNTIMKDSPILKAMPIRPSDIENGACKESRAASDRKYGPLLGLQRLSNDEDGLITLRDLENWTESSGGEFILPKTDCPPGSNQISADFLAKIQPVKSLPAPTVQGITSFDITRARLDTMYNGPEYLPSNRNAKGLGGATKKKRGGGARKSAGPRKAASRKRAKLEAEAAHWASLEPKEGKNDASSYAGDRGTKADGGPGNVTGEEDSDESDDDDEWEREQIAEEINAAHEDPDNDILDDGDEDEPSAPLLRRVLGTLADQAEIAALTKWAAKPAGKKRLTHEMFWNCLLNPTGSLAGNVIDDYGQLLMDTDKSAHPATTPSFIICDTNLMRCLMGRGVSVMPPLEKRTNLWQYSDILVPTIVGPGAVGNHWILLHARPMQQTITVLDPLGLKHTQAAKCLGHFLELEQADRGQQVIEWTYHSAPELLPRQSPDNGWDCGVFVCQYMESIANDRQWDFSQENMPWWRIRMARELADRKLIEHSYESI